MVFQVRLLSELWTPRDTLRVCVHGGTHPFTRRLLPRALLGGAGQGGMASADIPWLLARGCTLGTRTLAHRHRQHRSGHGQQTEGGLNSRIKAEHHTLGKLAAETSHLVASVRWEELVRRTWGASNLTPSSVRNLPHKASRLLDHLRRRGSSVVISTPPWGTAKCDKAF